MKLLNTLTFFLIFLLFPSINISAQKNPLQVLYEEGIARYNAGDCDKAIELMEKVISVYPKLPQSHYVLGVCYKNHRKEFEKSVGYLNQTIALEPGNAYAYEELSSVYYTLGDVDKAEKSALKAIEIEPGMYSVRMALAWIYLIGKKEPGNAIKYFKEINAVADVPKAHFGLGLAYFQDGQRLAVLEAVTKLRQLGEEPMAKHLETMVRENRYIIPVVEGVPLSPPVEQKNNRLAEEPLELPVIAAEESQPIRLRKRTPTPSGAEQTGTDRIRTLQQRGQQSRY